MKKPIHYSTTVFLMLFIGSIMGSTQNLMAATKYALIVGIGQQPSDSKWKPTSAHHDVEVMKMALRSKGFDSIFTLSNSEATKTAILEAFDHVRRNARPGDVFAFHFSGHGQQMADDNADELDGYDEALVCYGAPMEFDGWYKDEHHLRDDQVTGLIDKIRAKLGAKGEVMIFVDAGFGSKNAGGFEHFRGGAKPYQSVDFVNNAHGFDQNAGIYEDRPFGMPNLTYAPIVTLSAAESSLVSAEQSGNGALTMALDRALENLKPGERYPDLFEEIQEAHIAMSLNQYPILQGDVDTEIFVHSGFEILSEKFTPFSAGLDPNINLSMIIGYPPNHLEVGKEDSPRKRSYFSFQ